MKVEQKQFLKMGSKEVIHFIAASRRFNNDDEAINALHNSVRQYELICGKPYNLYMAPDNPFVAIIIHGIND